MKFTLTGALALGFFGAMAGVGCGSDPEKESPDESNVAIDAFLDEYTKLSCSRVFDCCDASEVDTLFNGANPKPKNEAECVAFVLPIFEQVYGDLPKSVKEGRQEYDGKKAASCFSKLKAQCGEPLSDDELVDNPDCATVFVGKVADGGACTDDGDCSGAKSTCYASTCRPLGAEGQPCAYADDCVSEYCNQDGACAEKKANGQACGGSSDCQSERCDLNTNKCIEKAAEGAACSVPFDCTTGNCDQAVCAAKKADGAACNMSSECKSNGCDFDTNVCAPTKAGPLCDGK